uniref:Uncharacterized protein n=1 Tax=mine drainage metagenome TaxID=410659 RepID=E6Q5P8_9ZZZZ
MGQCVSILVVIGNSMGIHAAAFLDSLLICVFWRTVKYRRIGTSYFAARSAMALGRGAARELLSPTSRLSKRSMR